MIADIIVVIAVVIVIVIVIVFAIVVADVIIVVTVVIVIVGVGISSAGVECHADLCSCCKGPSIGEKDAHVSRLNIHHNLKYNEVFI